MSTEKVQCKRAGGKADLISCVVEERLEIHDVWMGDKTHDLELAILTGPKRQGK